MTGGRLFHLANSSVNIGSIAALFAAPFVESLDFAVESAIVRSLSWALVKAARWAAFFCAPLVVTERLQHVALQCAS
jgi:hypothetical protein